MAWETFRFIALLKGDAPLDLQGHVLGDELGIDLGRFTSFMLSMISLS